MSTLRLLFSFVWVYVRGSYVFFDDVQGGFYLNGWDLFVGFGIWSPVRGSYVVFMVFGGGDI